MLEAAHHIALTLEPLFKIGFSLGAVLGVIVLIKYP